MYKKPKALPYPHVEPRQAPVKERLVPRDPRTKVPLTPFTPATLRMLLLTAMGRRP